MTALIVLATDKGFFVPSLVVASQVRSFSHRNRPDIHLYLSDFTDEEFAEVSWIAEVLDVTFVRVSTDMLKVDATFERHFQRGISATALMRLAIVDIIPPHYDHIVYLDGDMQVLGSLDELLDNPPPEGEIAAVAEVYVILREPDGTPRAWVRDYICKLGLSEEPQYFNSGMLSFRLSTWKGIAPQALAFFRDNADICPNYDQSALNAVLKGRWQHIHPAYNWHTYFNKLASPDGFAPKIVHFTSRPKPWQPDQHDWSPAFYKPYAEMLDRFPVLRRYFSIREPVSLGNWLRYYRNLAKKKLQNKRYRIWLREYLGSRTFRVKP